MMTMEVKGLKELQDQLLELGAKMAVKTLARAARKAFKPVLQAARNRVPKDSRLLMRRIRLQVVRPRGGDAVVVVGLRLGKTPHRIKKKVKHEARNWAWFEMGIPSRGIAAQPFLRPAMDANADRVMALLKEELAKEIAKAVAAKKGKTP